MAPTPLVDTSHLPIRNAYASVVIPDFISFGPDDFACNNSSSHHKPASTGATTALDYSDRVVDSYKSFDEEDVPSPRAVVVPDSDKNTVPVLVSGHPFSMDHSAFEQLKKLPWKQSGDEITLHASPELFEIVLNYLLFKTMPETKLLSSHDKEELDAMAKMLELTELASALSSRSSFRNRRRASSVLKARESSTKSMGSKTATKGRREESIGEIKITTSQDTEPTADESSEGTTTSGEQLKSPASSIGTKEQETKNSPRGKPPKKMDSSNGFRGSFKRAFSFRGSGHSTRTNSSKGSFRSNAGSQRSLAEEEWYSDIVA